MFITMDSDENNRNPCRRVRKVRTDSRRTRYLSFEEEARLCEKLEGQEWVQRIVAMAINTGMRQGEIFDPFLQLQPPKKTGVFTSFPISYHRIYVVCCYFWSRIGQLES